MAAVKEEEEEEYPHLTAFLTPHFNRQRALRSSLTFKRRGNNKINNTVFGEITS